MTTTMKPQDWKLHHLPTGVFKCAPIVGVEGTQLLLRRGAGVDPGTYEVDPSWLAQSAPQAGDLLVLRDAGPTIIRAGEHWFV